jgi:hypothetical protein
MIDMGFLIDGYNLLNHAPIPSPGPRMTREGRRQGELETARGELLEFLATHLSEKERVRSSVVFDARDAPPGLPRKSHYKGIAVHFASDYPDADTMIESLIRAHTAPRSLTVVSSDRRLQAAARRRRARAADSKKWYLAIARRSPDSGRRNSKFSPIGSSVPQKRNSLSRKILSIFRGKKDPEPFVPSEPPPAGAARLSEQQVEAWMKYFGFEGEAREEAEAPDVSRQGVSDTSKREPSNRRSPQRRRPSSRSTGAHRKGSAEGRGRNRPRRKERAKKADDTERRAEESFFPDEYLEEIQRMIDEEEGGSPSRR